MYRLYEALGYIDVLDNLDRTAITIFFGPEGDIKTKHQARIVGMAIIRLLPSTSAKNNYIAAKSVFNATLEAYRSAQSAADARLTEIHKAHDALSHAYNMYPEGATQPAEEIP